MRKLLGYSYFSFLIAEKNNPEYKIGEITCRATSETEARLQFENDFVLTLIEKSNSRGMTA